MLRVSGKHSFFSIGGISGGHDLKVALMKMLMRKSRFQDIANSALKKLVEESMRIDSGKEATVSQFKQKLEQQSLVRGRSKK